MDAIQSSLQNPFDQSIALPQSGVMGGIKKAVTPDTQQNLNSFGQLLQDQIQQINNLQADANKAVETYAIGGDIELHNVIGAVEKADMALQLATQVRNKMVSAYQEVSRMQF